MRRWKLQLGVLGGGLGTAAALYKYKSRSTDHSGFVSARLIEKRQETHDTVVLKLDCAPLVSRSHPVAWHVMVKEPNLQIARAYSPVPCNVGETSAGDNPNDICLLVKRYRDGPMSRYLHRLKADNTLELAGPYASGPESFWHKKRNVDELIFLVGGTGITPAVQILDHYRRLSLCGDKKKEVPNCKLIFANKSEADILLSKELHALQRSMGKDKLQIEYNLDSRGDTFAKAVDSLRCAPLHGGERLVLICGPDGMVEALAGVPRHQHNHAAVTRRSNQGVQGELRGALAVAFQNQEIVYSSSNLDGFTEIAQIPNLKTTIFRL